MKPGALAIVLLATSLCFCGSSNQLIQNMDNQTVDQVNPVSHANQSRYPQLTTESPTGEVKQFTESIVPSIHVRRFASSEVRAGSFSRSNLDAASRRADPVAVTASLITQPPSVVERTTKASVSYILTYSNGSYVRSSTNAVVRIVNSTATVAQVALRLTNSTTGMYTATWVPAFSTNLAKYSFVFDPASFKDESGNQGQGEAIVSSSFELVPAKLTLDVETKSPLSRREPVTIAIPAVYHDGSHLRNITQLKGSIVDANGTAYPLKLVSNGTFLNANFMASADAHLGTWQLNANFTDAYENSGSGAFPFQLIKTTFKFTEAFPKLVQRTTTLNVSAAVSYLDNAPLTSGITGSIKVGNNTQPLIMRYIAGNKTWLGIYHLSQNATLGNYNITIRAADSFGNEHNFTSLVSVIPARFIISVPNQHVQVNPLTMAEIVASVTYPNGTALTQRMGLVSAFYTNSTGGTSRLLLEYNATEMKWHVTFLTPDQRFKLFVITLVFSFEARDIYGNYGFASDAYSMTVTTPPRLLILALIAGIIIPVALLAWAMMTITKRRRKYKP